MKTPLKVCSTICKGNLYVKERKHMTEEEGRSGDVSDTGNTSSLFSFDIRGLERCLSKCHFNHNNLEEGGKK